MLRGNVSIHQMWPPGNSEVTGILHVVTYYKPSFATPGSGPYMGVS